MKTGIFLKQLVRDENRQPVQIGSSFETTSSPFTLTGGIDTIPVPDNGVEFIVNPQTHDIFVSEKSDLTTYDIIAASTKESIPCARMDNIYIQGTGGDTVNFRFTLV